MRAGSCESFTGPPPAAQGDVQDEVFGVVAGGVVGLLFVMMVTLRIRVDTLQEELQRIMRASSVAAPYAERVSEPR